jgi:hypothetical protein
MFAGLSAAAWTPVLRAQHYSAYEEQVIASALKGRGERPEPMPEGKLVEEVRLVLIDVFDPLDPVPDWINVFHTRTRERVIERELLFARGEPYRSALIDETERNLRQLFQLSLVLIVPLRGSEPDRVKVLVITKDVWSIRLSYDPEVQRVELIRLDGALSEINLAGLHQTIAARTGLDPAIYYYGAAYENLRVAGSRIRAYGSGHVIVNRDHGNVEGSFGGFSYGQPLWSLATEWSWGTLFSWREDIERDFVGTAIDTYDAPATPGDDALPRVWDRELFFGQYALTRSVGHLTKLDWTLGAEVARSRFDPGDLSRYQPAAVAQFRQFIVPVTDQRIGPFLALRAHSNRFLRTLNLETLALQEDVALGHDLTVKLYPALSEAESTRDLLGIEASLGYTVPLGDGLVRGVVLSTTELAAQTGGTDALLRGWLHVATPSLGFGRLVLGSTVASRYRDYFRSRFVVGGDNRLRGYLADEFRGKDLVALNLEYRTPPLDVLSAQIGAALFYDVADAFNGFENLCPKQGAGLGVRMVLPQFNRAVLRIDWGLPVERNRACDLAHGRRPALAQRDLWQGLFLAFEQAFGLPPLVRRPLPDSLAR